MDRQTKARIDSLLYELRSWDPSCAAPLSLTDLARNFGLDPLIVKRIAESEGWVLNGVGVPEEVSNDVTEPLNFDEEK